MTLGRSYIEKLIDDFGGSYPLAIAAYNAGPGRVRQWLRDFGDPRGRDIDMVDWIEMIPFNETRIYVQRVLENLQIYRGQTGDNPAPSRSPRPRPLIRAARVPTVPPRSNSDEKSSPSRPVGAA